VTTHGETINGDYLSVTITGGDKTR